MRFDLVAGGFIQLALDVLRDGLLGETGHVLNQLGRGRGDTSDRGLRRRPRRPGEPDAGTEGLGAPHSVLIRCRTR